MASRSFFLKVRSPQLSVSPPCFLHFPMKAFKTDTRVLGFESFRLNLSLREFILFVNHRTENRFNRNHVKFSKLWRHLIGNSLFRNIQLLLFQPVKKARNIPAWRTILFISLHEKKTMRRLLVEFEISREILKGCQTTGKSVRELHSYHFTAKSSLFV